jgi:EmrB/QacA subfamily drug resistance transporter
VNMSRGNKVLALTSVGVMLVSLDISIVNVAFRSFVAEWPESRRLLTWVFSAYNIAYAAGLLTAGRLADAFGRKRAFLSGLAVFMVGSLLCAISPSALILVLARIVQALGGAIITPSAIALVLPEFPVEKRSAAIGIWGAVGAVAAASGPTIGGVIVDTLSWHWVFLINVPLCIIALLIGRTLLHESRDDTAPRMVDVPGAVFAVVGVGALTLLIVQSDQWGWTSQSSILSLGVSIAALLVFGLRCTKTTHPLLDLRLFRLPFVSAAALSGFGFSAGFFSLIFINTQWLQAVWEYSPSRSGLAGIPGPVMAAIVAAPAGRAAQRFGHGKVVALGGVILFSGNIALRLTIPVEPAYLTHYLPIMIYTGIGVGLCISTISSAATAFLPRTQFAMGSALNNTIRQIGAALGIALVSSILLTAISAGDPISGYHRSWVVTSVIILASGIAMLVLFRRPTQDQLSAASSLDGLGKGKV